MSTRGEKIKKAIKIFLIAIPWLLVCGYAIFAYYRFMTESPFGPLDVSRRVTAPNSEKTAMLVRSRGSFIDLNFALYVTDGSEADFMDIGEKAEFYTDDKWSYRGSAPLWITRALWTSHDYDPDTRINWHEDIVWSNDSQILAVIVEDEYLFAYDFGSSLGSEDSQTIISLLEAHK